MRRVHRGLKYLNGATPYELPCYGHLSDAVIRNLGVPLVTGDIPGVAVILSSAPLPIEAVALVKSYQSQGILVTLVGGVIDQLEEKGYKTGDNVRVIPLGKDVTAVIHVVSVALRAALIFGNITPGDAGSLMKYTMERVPAFVNAFKPLDDVIVACGAGAIALGFPVVTNETEHLPRPEEPHRAGGRQQVQRHLPRGARHQDQDHHDRHSCLLRFPRSKARSSARSDMQVEVGGSRKDCFELVTTRRRRRDRGPQDHGRRPRSSTRSPSAPNFLSYIVEVAGRTCSPTSSPLWSARSTPSELHRGRYAPASAI